MAIFKPIVILEGFDKTGKATYANHNLQDYRKYYPDPKFVKGEGHWAASCGILDFLNRSKSNYYKIMLCQSIFSDYVYSKLYGGKIPDELWIDKDFLKKEVTIIHVKHRDKLTARQIYEGSTPDDTFKSFDEYWDMYQKAEAYYNEIYTKLGIKPVYAIAYIRFDGSPLWGTITQ